MIGGKWNSDPVKIKTTTTTQRRMLEILFKIIIITRDPRRDRKRSSTAGEGHERRGRSSNSCATEWRGRDGLGRPVVCVRADSGSVCSRPKERARRDGGALYTSRRQPVPTKTHDPFRRKPPLYHKLFHHHKPPPTTTNSHPATAVHCIHIIHRYII